MPFELTPEFNDTNQSPRHERILQTLKERGAQSLRDFAVYLATTDIYTEEERLNYQLNGMIADIRRALKSLDNQGLPKAGPTAVTSESGSPLWTPRDMFSYADYCLNFTGYKQRGRANFVIAERFLAECVERYHKPPVEDYFDGGE
jgi:hypothetical protein